MDKNAGKYDKMQKWPLKLKMLVFRGFFSSKHGPSRRFCPFTYDRHVYSITRCKVKPDVRLKGCHGIFCWSTYDTQDNQISCYKVKVAWNIREGLLGPFCVLWGRNFFVCFYIDILVHLFMKNMTTKTWWGKLALRDILVRFFFFWWGCEILKGANVAKWLFHTKMADSLSLYELLLETVLWVFAGWLKMSKMSLKWLLESKMSDSLCFGYRQIEMDSLLTTFHLRTNLRVLKAPPMGFIVARPLTYDLWFPGGIAIGHPCSRCREASN